MKALYALYPDGQSAQQAVNRLSNALAALGVSRGERVAIVLPQRPETAIAHLACHQLGAIAMPLSALFGPEALEYRLADAEAAVAIVDAVALANLQPIRTSLPALSNNLVNLIKTTNLAYAIAVPELMYSAKQIWADSLNVREMMFTVLIFYVCLASLFAWGMTRLERWLRADGTCFELRLPLRRAGAEVAGREEAPLSGAAV